MKRALLIYDTVKRGWVSQVYLLTGDWNVSTNPGDALEYVSIEDWKLLHIFRFDVVMLLRQCVKWLEICLPKEWTETEIINYVNNKYSNDWVIASMSTCSSTNKHVLVEASDYHDQRKSTNSV